MFFDTARTALSNLEGGTFVGLDSLTQVKLKGGKKNTMQGRVTKRMTGATVMCFSNTNSNAYENMVKRRLLAEGKNADDFTLSDRTWGQRISNTAFVEHNDKFYLEVIFMNAGKTEYLLDNQPIEKSQIEGLDDPAEGSQGGLENKVVLRTFAVDSITALRINGQEYR